MERKTGQGRDHCVVNRRVAANGFPWQLGTARPVLADNPVHPVRTQRERLARRQAQGDGIIGPEHAALAIGIEDIDDNRVLAGFEKG